MNRITTILSPARPAERPPSSRSLSLPTPAVTAQRVAQQTAADCCSPSGMRKRSEPTPEPDGRSFSSKPTRISATVNPPASMLWTHARLGIANSAPLVISGGHSLTELRASL